MRAHREMVSGITHLIGAVLALIGVIWLILLTNHDLPTLVTVIIFGVSVVLLYMASTTMHMLSSLKGGQHHLVLRFQRLDHAAIYVMIAGCYTPLTYSLLTFHWRWVMLAIIWLLALAGAFMKLIFFYSGHFSTACYLVMGWVGVIAAPQALPVIDPNALWLLATGGVIYTIGAVIYALRKPDLHLYFGHHELWHLFVMAGTACHFLAIGWCVV